MAQCRQCGAKLPALTFGSAPEYCKNCQSQQVPAQPQIIDYAPPASTMQQQPVLWATTALIAINVAVYVAMVVSGVSPITPSNEHLLKWGADYGPYTFNGQYWRAISSAFVHGGVIHLLVNMWCLWNLGRLLEKFLGPFVTIAVYFLTALGASMLSLSWEPIRISVGASGAIFGVAGVLITVLYYGKFNLLPESVKKLLGYVVRFALINLAYGFVAARVDNMAHLGGLVSGLLIGLFLAQTVALPTEERTAAQAYRLLASAVCLVLLFGAVARAKSYAVELGKGENAIDAKQYDLAIQHFQKYLAERPNDFSGHVRLGMAYHSSGRLDEAASEYRRATSLSNDPHKLAPLEVALASAYLEKARFPEARDLYKNALPYVKANADMYQEYGKSLKETGDLAGAEAALRKSIAMDEKDPETHRELAQVLLAEGKRVEADKESRLALLLEPAK